MKSYKLLTLSAALVAFAVSAVQAQQTWSGSSTGTWDSATTPNWDAAATWLNGSDAIFGAGIDTIQLDAGVTVADLTLNPGAGTVNIQSIVDDTALTLVGSPTWALGTNTLHLVNTNPDTLLSMTAGETLTVTGAGTFNTGEKPNDASNSLWQVSGAMLDFQGGTLRGNSASVGEFDSVKMVGGSKFIYERNADQVSTSNWTNNWELGSGVVTFDNRFSRSYRLNGVVSGSGTMLVENLAGSYLELSGVNTFTGGVIVDSSNSVSRLVVSNDNGLGAVPVAFETNNITLRNGGALKVTGATGIDANRGLELDGGGTLIGNNFFNFQGAITGDGGLQIGLDSDTAAGKINIPSASTNHTYSGGVDIVKGRLYTYHESALGIEPATFQSDNITLRNGGVLRMGKSGGMTLSANRGITLADGGGNLSAQQDAVINGPITGTGSLTIGDAGDSNGKKITTLNSTDNDYGGKTTVYRGFLSMGVENGLPTNGVLTIGGANTSVFDVNGLDQTIGGLTSAANNNRAFRNNGGGTSATVTFNVESGKNYWYGANFSGTDPIHLVKNGLGTQRFSKNGYTTPPASITVNSGFFGWNSTGGPTGLTTVNAGGTVGGFGTFSTNVVLNSGAGIAPGNPNDHGTLTVEGDLELSGMIDDNAGGIEISFGASDHDQIVATGTIDMDGAGDDYGFADFTFLDTTGIADGVYTVMVAGTISGTLDSLDNTGPVGSMGASGTLSADTGVVLLTVVAGDYSEFGLWATGYGLFGDAAATDADPDADNYDNIQEYAFGGDPTNGAVQGYVPVSEIVVDGSTNWLTYTYSYLSATNSGVSLSAETTDNLVIGTWETNGVTLFGTSSNNAPYITYTNGIPMDGTIDFLGVFVEQTP